MTLKTLNPLITALSLLAIFALATACGSSNDSSPGTVTAGTGGVSGSAGAASLGGTGGEAGTPACPDFLGFPSPGSGCHDGACFGCLTEIQPMSFAVGMFSITDDSGVTTANLRTDAGSVCMSGVSVGWGILSLVLGSPEHQTLDAAALGITQIEFTVETPPSSGVVPSLVMAIADMDAAGFSLTSDGAPVTITGPTTTIRAPLSDYTSPDSRTSPDYVLDPSQLLSITFNMGTAEHYDFCVRDLKFFNANDVEVLPTP